MGIADHVKGLRLHLHAEADPSMGGSRISLSSGSTTTHFKRHGAPVAASSTDPGTGIATFVPVEAPRPVRSLFQLGGLLLQGFVPMREIYPVFANLNQGSKRSPKCSFASRTLRRASKMSAFG